VATLLSDKLRQLVYVSRATRIFSGDELVLLAAAAANRNRESDVGGALLYGRGLFLQALEGEPAGVEEVFTRIKRDTRHAAVQVLADHFIETRAFARWAMTPVTLDNQPNWTDEHMATVQRMMGVASVVRPGLAAHTLIGTFTKHTPRLAA